MSAIKDGRYPIMLDKERHLLFSLNVLDEFNDKSGGYDKMSEFLLPEVKPNFKNIRWLFTLLVNEGADDGEEAITESHLGKLIHIGNLNEIINAIFKAFSRGSVGDKEPDDSPDDEDDEDDEKNSQSGQDR